ncbi:BQ2448_8100 [Microbotryum intermedium]|uniref:BQ2448_8100 protein n=1 Tax=Microbotryum intermedium TaxID=269621 RepID=A0A238FQI3_9BASI|nr:BQ2448_8100 [Microbotryum intermedium]
MNFFKSSSSKIKTPSELVRSTREAIHRLDSASTSAEGKRKASEDMSKNLFQMKLLLYGDGENEPQPELIAQLAQEVYAKDILQLLVLHIWRFEFEVRGLSWSEPGSIILQEPKWLTLPVQNHQARKDVSQIFNNLLRRQIGSRWPTVEYLSAKEETIFAALKGYENAEVALNTGMILREMLRHEPLARTLLYSDRFYDFIDYIEQTTFGIACDAQANFKETLTRHKSMVAEYLEENYDRFFSSYALLVQSTNYVTKRQSLKLLGEILLDRTNFKVMTRYIANEENLKMMMNLLKDRSKNIQFEAFHVFKVFVANPKKPPQIEAILKRNRMKLVTFLQGFHNDREDEQFTVSAS